MTVDALANALRERLRHRTDHTPDYIDSLSDDEVIAPYVTCSHCGGQEVTDEDLEFAIGYAETAEDFLLKIGGLRSKHDHGTTTWLASVDYNVSTSEAEALIRIDMSAAEFDHLRNGMIHLINEYLAVNSEIDLDNADVAGDVVLFVMEDAMAEEGENENGIAHLWMRAFTVEDEEGSEILWINDPPKFAIASLTGVIYFQSIVQNNTNQ
jgi:hypothetical protein